jgi:hypothetical protein
LSRIAWAIKHHTPVGYQSNVVLDGVLINLHLLKNERRTIVATAEESPAAGQGRWGSAAKSLTKFRKKQLRARKRYWARLNLLRPLCPAHLGKAELGTARLGYSAARQGTAPGAASQNGALFRKRGRARFCPRESGARSRWRRQI